MGNIIKVIGNRIKNIRTEKGFSQEELAYKANLSCSYFGQLERGAKSAGIETLEKLSNALSVSIADFFTDIQAPPDKRDDTELSILIEKLNLVSPSDRKTLIELIDLLFLNKDRPRG